KGLWVLAHRPFRYTSFAASGQHGPKLPYGLFGRGCAAGGFGGLPSALPCPPVFGIVLPDGLIEVFFKPLFVLDTVGDLPELFVQQLPEHYAFLCVLLIADIALVLEAAFFGRRGENGGYLVCHHRSAVAGGRYQKHPRTEGFTALHLAPRGAFRRMEHSARPAPIRLHERCLFQDGFQFRGKIGIFPKDTGGLPAAGVHQQGIGVAVRFGTAAQQSSVVIAGRVIA
ncbi:Stage 0 sporulation A-like protein, partial [Dysosmobacter welbionis]